MTALSVHDAFVEIAVPMSLNEFHLVRKTESLLCMSVTKTACNKVENPCLCYTYFSWQNQALANVL